jgi:hypothetical protein
MSYTLLVSFVILVRIVASICEPIPGSVEFQKAYLASNFKPPRWDGSFGTVFDFQYNHKKYAVKEITLKASSQTQKEIDNLTIYDKKGFDSFVTFFKTHYLNHHNFSLDRITEESRINQLYYNDIISDYNAFLNEVSVSKQVSDAMIKTPEITFKYHFCIKLPNFTFLAVYDGYGEALDSKNSREFFSSASIEQRLEVYLKITWALINLHKNNVFHCNLNFRNILWTDKVGSDIVIIGYRFGKYEYCQKGTQGFNAPDFFDKYYAGLALGLKTDVYSLAILISDLEFRAIHNILSLVDEQTKYEIDRFAQLNNSEILQKIDLGINAEYVVYARKYKERDENFDHLLLNFGQFLKFMLEFNPSKRYSLQESFKYLWVIFQNSRYLHTDYEKVYYPRNTKLKEIRNRIVHQLDKLIVNRYQGVEFFEWKPNDYKFY